MSGAQPPPPVTRVPRMFVALSYPNFRLWFIGQMVSLMGTWMQMTAQGYLVFQLTQSSAYLGYVAFASGLPTWFLTMYGGVAADRMSRRTLIILTQCGMMVLALVLAVLVFTGAVRPWHILGLAFLLGIANSFDAPARQSFILEMVERKHLTNAIALNATMFHIGTAVGPAIAGFAYAAFGPGWCFLLNGVSFIAVIIALALMQLPPFELPAGRTSARADLAEGLRYVARHSIIRAVIALIAVTSLFAIGVFTLMPAWAVKILHGDAQTLGFLQSSRGLGALIGALTLASLSHYRFKGRLLTIGTFVFPAMLFVFAWMRALPLALLACIAVGSAQLLVMNLANAIVQSRVVDGLRGRVMGLYTLMFFGVMPLGGLWAGTLAEAVGEPAVVILASGGLLLSAVALRAFAPDLGRVQTE